MEDLAIALIPLIVLFALMVMLIGTSAHFQRKKSLKLQVETNELLRELIAEFRAGGQAPEPQPALQKLSN
jgi:hypothetical protein